MSTLTVKKDLLVVEDMALGEGPVIQERGEGTLINASELPFDASKSIKEAVDLKEDTTTVNAKLATKADLNGNPLEVFQALQGTNDKDVVILAKLVAELLLKADITYVDDQLTIKANIANVLLKDGSSPLFTPISDNQPTNKKYVDDLIISVGAGDMLKAVYDTANTGAVDTAEAIGRLGTLLGKTPMNQIMRLSQSNILDCNTTDDFGIFVGTDVPNAPTSGLIVLEQLIISTGKLQRCFSVNTSKWYARTYKATIWSGWAANASEDYVDTANAAQDEVIALNTAKVTGADRVLKAGDVMTGQLKGITPLANEDLTRKDYVDTKETPVGATAKVTAHADLRSSSVVFGHSKMSVSGSTLTITTI